MERRKIQTDDEHQAAVERINQLWDAAPGTPDHDELDDLWASVDAYEDGRWPLSEH